MDTWQVIDYVQAGMLARHKTWRAGQALFNAIDLVRPDLADQIRGTDLDPFHSHAKIAATCAWLKQALAAPEVSDANS